MKRIATKKAKKGKKEVSLLVYDTDNIIMWDDNVNNFHKVVHEQNFAKAEVIFYQWVLGMYKIKTNLTLDPA